MAFWRRYLKFMIMVLFLLATYLTTGCGLQQMLDGFWNGSAVHDNDDNEEERPFLLPKDEGEQDYDNEELRWSRIYYLDKEGRFLMPTTVGIPWTEGIARAAVEHLVASPVREVILSQYDLLAPLPEGTTIRGLTINDGLASIDFNASFIDYPLENEEHVLSSVILTLAEFSTVERVKILVEGIELPEFPGGTPGEEVFGPNFWINLEVDERVEDYHNTSTVLLYFCYPLSRGDIFYVPVTRVIPSEENLLQAAIEELLKGPRQSSLFSEIPPQTTLLGLSKEENFLVLNFSAGFLSYDGGKTGEENIVNQLTLTLTSHPEIEAVKILIEGEERVLKGTSLAELLRAPEKYNCLPVFDYF
ncbi:MAG: GerMN domain-containing protein [Dethiobacteria bacterium]